MAPVIWGLNLGDIQWSKFKSSYMWNSDYHLRRTKFIIYQAAMILCVISESLGTDALSNFLSQQDYLKKHTNGQALQHNNDYIGVASYNIFCGIFVAFVFGAAFFFDLFWPERYESPSIKMAWKACAVVSCVLTTANVIAYTVIVSSRQAYVTGISPQEAARLLSERESYNTVYRKNSRALSSLIILWLGWPCVIASTIILWLAKSHDDRLGPLSSHERDQRARAVANGDMGGPAGVLPIESKQEANDIDTSANAQNFPADKDFQEKSHAQPNGSADPFSNNLSSDLQQPPAAHV